jgi:hypothetical protein
MTKHTSYCRIVYCLFLAGVIGVGLFLPRAARSQDKEFIKGPSVLLVLRSKDHPAAPDLEKFVSGLQDALRRYPSTIVISANKTKEVLALDRPDESLEEDISTWSKILHDTVFSDSSSNEPSSQSRLDILKKLLGTFEKTAPSPGRWQLYELAICYYAMVQYWMIALHEQGAPTLNEWMDTYVKLLRTRPLLKLSDTYSNQEMSMLDKARIKIKAMKKGKLKVESDPADAEVLLDGVSFGRTPFSGEFIPGKYHLQLVHPQAGKISMWVNIGAKETSVKANIALEQAIDLSAPYLTIKLANDENAIPKAFVPALNEVLGINSVIMVKQTTDKEGSKTRVGVTDLSTGTIIREAEVEPKGADALPTSEDVQNFALFIVAGKARGNVEDLHAKKEPQKQVSVSTVTPTKQPRHELTTSQTTVQEKKQVKPWYRKWYWYTIAGSVFIGGAIGTTVVAMSYQSDANKDSYGPTREGKQNKANAFLGGAICGYAIGAALIITGAVLDATYEPSKPPPVAATKGFSLLMGGDYVIGLQWGTEF